MKFRLLLPLFLSGVSMAQPAGSFIPTGAMTTPRNGHSATLLPNGKVLVAGGESTSNPLQPSGGAPTLFGSVEYLSSTEINDPATQAFTPSGNGVFTSTGSMMRARDNHTATLLPDGTVLMAGGESQNCGSDGCWFSGTESSAELYDPVAGVFAPAGNMTASREGQTATLLNSGDVLITGGIAWTTGVPVLASAELYHPATTVPAPALFSLSGVGNGQGAIWHAITSEIASPENPAMTGEVLSMYTTNLAGAGVIPPQVIVGGRSADVIYFGPAPGYSGYYQVNFLVPDGVAAVPGVSVRWTYLGRSSNRVTIGVQ